MHDALQEATDAMVARGKRWRRARDAWGAWVGFWRRRARELTVAAKCAAAAATIAASIKAILLMRSRDVGRPDLPPGNDMATLATDRVEKPTPGR